MADTGCDNEAGNKRHEVDEAFLIHLTEAHKMHKLGEAEDENASDFIWCPDQNRVGEEGEKECEHELVILFVLLVGVDNAEEDAGVFEE